MKLNYLLKGKGKETVLFLHGWGADLNSFNFFSQELSYKFNTLQVDFCGFGKSEKLQYSFTVFDYAVEVFKLLKELEIGELIIIAHSFGVRVAILLSTMFDLKINKMVFIGGAGIKPKFNIIKSLKIYNYKFLKKINKLKIFKFKLNKIGSKDYVNLNQIEKQTFIKIVNYNEKNLLKYITQKTLLVWGSDDDATPPYMGKIMKRNIPNAKLVVIKNAGHFCFITHHDFVNSQIHKFLS